jgi:hypothetical protein
VSNAGTLKTNVKTENSKKKIKRLMNKRLRKGKDGNAYNFYWA